MLVGVDFHFSRVLVAVWLLPAVVGVATLVASKRARAPNRSVVDVFVHLLIAGYLLGVVAITLWPFQFDFETGRIFDRGNWAPFGGTLGFLISENSLKVRVASRDFAANLLLFAPLGLLLSIRQRRGSTVVIVVVLLIAIAFALEVIQGLTIAERTLDIDDAISGSIGAVLASAVGGILRGFVNGRRTRLPEGLPSSVG